MDTVSETPHVVIFTPCVTYDADVYAGQGGRRWSRTTQLVVRHRNAHRQFQDRCLRVPNQHRTRVERKLAADSSDSTRWVSRDFRMALTLVLLLVSFHPGMNPSVQLCRALPFVVPCPAKRHHVSEESARPGVVRALNTTAKTEKEFQCQWVRVSTLNCLAQGPVIH